MCTDCNNTINELPYGSQGLDGASSYVYIATASDSSGTDFALYTDNPTQCWKAILVSTTEVVTPQASDFTGLWFNTCGSSGSNGTNGTNGREGVDGATWFTDTSVPNDEDGTNGDFYLRSTNGYFYEKIGGVWVYQGTLKGANGNDGTDGADGAVWYNGSGAPSGSATSGDFYLNTANGDVYKYNGSSWVLTTNIQGPKGDTGDTGAQGDPGTSTMTTVQESDGDPSVTSVEILQVANTDLPPVVSNPASGTALLDFNIPFADIEESSSSGNYLYYSQTYDSVGADYLNASAPHNSTDTCWYAYIGDGINQQARRLKLKKYNDGAFTLIGLIQKKMKGSITDYNMQDADDTLTVSTGSTFFSNKALFNLRVNTSITPTLNLCQIFPCTIYVHTDSNFNGTIFGAYQGNCIICSGIIQVVGFNAITGLSSGSQYYMTININHTFGNPKTGTPNYL